MASARPADGNFIGRSELAGQQAFHQGAVAGDAERGLSAALGKLFALAEAYPQLRAAENFSQLQGSLAQIEEAVQSARRYYNAVVRDFNTKIAQVPWNIFASLFNFKSREFFQISDETERAVPSVKFN